MVSGNTPPSCSQMLPLKCHILMFLSRVLLVRSRSPSRPTALGVSLPGRVRPSCLILPLTRCLGWRPALRWRCLSSSFLLTAFSLLSWCVCACFCVHRCLACVCQQQQPEVSLSWISHLRCILALQMEHCLSSFDFFTSLCKVFSPLSPPPPPTPRPLLTRRGGTQLEAPQGE